MASRQQHRRGLEGEVTVIAREWRELLSQWSADVLERREYRQELPAEVVKSGWLGYPGASEEAIAQAEARLGVQLPPSYKEFLRVSNGWRMTSPFIERVWSVEKIEWFAKRRPDWVNAWKTGLESVWPPGSHDPESDEEFRHLAATLEVSDVGDEAIYLLNPLVVSEIGEWEAWFFANWVPGAIRYASFWDLMVAEYQSFLRLRDWDE